MLAVYESLVRIAQIDYPDIVTGTSYLGGTSSSPNKLRLTLVDGSFVDIWLSADRDYAYHWERRRQAGQIYRWDNAPHHPTISTFPAHFHDGDEFTIQESNLSDVPAIALDEVLAFIRVQLG